MSISLAWWLVDAEGVCDAITSTLHKLSIQNQARLSAYRRWSQMYGVDVLGSTALERVNLNLERLNFNELGSIVDSLMAKIVKNRPLPMVTTEGASYTKRKRAQRLSRFLEGQFYDLRIYEHAQQVLLYALVFGLGALKLSVVGDSIVVERVLPHGLHVFNSDTVYNAPRQLFQVERVDRGLLAERYPEHRAAIEEAPEPKKSDDLFEYGDAESLVEVRYAWHLPSGLEASDGRYVLSLANEVLVDEPYTRDEFPFVFLRPKPPLMGFWGPSLVRDLAPGQTEYDVLNEKIQRSHRLIGGVHFIAQRGSSINYSQLDNDIGSIITVNGPPPEVWAPTPVSPDTYRYLDRVRETMREISGQSAMSVRSEKPAGITSGIALQTLDDVESERFMVLHRTWEQFFVDIARHMITLSDIVPNAKVKTKTSRGVELLHWADVSLPEDESIVEIFPTSMLAKTPAARLEQLQQLLSAQIIDTTRFRQLFQMPDVERDTELDAAVLDVVDAAFDRMLLDGEFVGPESFDDLGKVTERALKLYAHARAYNDIPEERLELCRRYIELAISLQTPPPPPPGPEAPVPGPGGTPPEAMIPLEGRPVSSAMATPIM